MNKISVDTRRHAKYFYEFLVKGTLSTKAGDIVWPGIMFNKKVVYVSYTKAGMRYTIILTETGSPRYMVEISGIPVEGIADHCYMITIRSIIESVRKAIKENKISFSSRNILHAKRLVEIVLKKTEDLVQQEP